MEIQLSDRVENIVGNREIARYEQFLLFPQKSRLLFVRQNEYLWSKGLNKLICKRKYYNQQKCIILIEAGMHVLLILEKKGVAACSDYHRP